MAQQAQHGMTVCDACDMPYCRLCAVRTCDCDASKTMPDSKTKTMTIGNEQDHDGSES